MRSAEALRARRRLARETGAIFKDWGGRLPVALIYPNSYYVGMSNLGLQTIYGLLNADDRLVCERAFYEGPQRGVRPTALISLESQRPLTDFPILAFSVSYELDYFQVVDTLRLAGLPLRSADRDESHPIVIAGGPAVTANPEPLSPFIDAFVLGEGEAILPSLMAALGEMAEAPRTETLATILGLAGVYVPLLASASDGQARPRRQWLASLEDVATTSVVLTPDTELGDLYAIETERGCGRGCRFCLAGFLFRPPRFRSAARLLEQAAAGLRYRQRIGLVGAAVSDHPELDELALGLRRMGAAFSVSSLRLDNLSEPLLRGLAESGTRTVALAPEAGTERLRRSINKPLTEEQIIEACARVAAHGIPHIKLYFMVGLPGETDDDVLALADLARACKEAADRRAPGTRFTLNVSPFVPKATTPFQWLPMTSPEVTGPRLRRLRQQLRPLGIEVAGESPQWSWIQGILARGDAAVGEILAELEEDNLAAWNQSLGKRGLTAQQMGDVPLGERLPWDRVDCGVETSYLTGELARARRGLPSPPCPPRDCVKCGVC